MKLNVAMIASTLLLLTLPLPSAQATGDCTFTATSWRHAYSQTISEILDVSDPAGCYGSEVEPTASCSVTVDGVPLNIDFCDGHVWCSCGEGPMVTASSDQPFSHGAHSVVVSITLHLSTGDETGSDSWSFYNAGTIETPRDVVVDVAEHCAVVLCAGPATLTIPVPVGAWVDTDRFFVLPGLTADVGTYGPDQRSVETPFGTFPVTICPTTCPFPVVSADYVTEGSIGYGVRVLGTEEDGEVPLTIGWGLA